MLSFNSTGILPSGFAVGFGILRNRHLTELAKKRPKGSEQNVLMEVIGEITNYIGESTKITAKDIGELTPIDFKALICMIRQNTYDYPTTIEQPLSYAEKDDNGNKTGKFIDFNVSEEIPDGEFAFTLGNLAEANGYKDKNNTVLKKYSDMNRTYTVTLPESKVRGKIRRPKMVVTMIAPTVAAYSKMVNVEDVCQMISQRRPTVEDGKGGIRLNIGDLPMNFSNMLLAEIDVNEGKVHTQTKFTHPDTGMASIIDFSDYPEFLLGK